MFKIETCFDHAGHAEPATENSGSLVSNEPSVLSIASGPSPATDAGTVGNYVLKVSCMPSMGQTSATTAPKATAAVQIQTTPRTHASQPACVASSTSVAVPAVDASQSSEIPRPKSPFNKPQAAEVPASDSSGLPTTQASIAAPERPGSVNATPLKKSASAALQAHTPQPVAAVTSAIPIPVKSAIPVTSAIPPQHTHTPSIAPAGALVSTAFVTAAVQSDAQKVEQEQDVKAQQRQRPASASAATTLGAPHATAMRNEARRVRSARLAARRSGEWGSGYSEGTVLLHLSGHTLITYCWSTLFSFSFTHSL